MAERSAASHATTRGSSASESSEAVRKLKHRELVKRSYYQKLEVLKQLRHQEQALSKQHSALLKYVQARPIVLTPYGPSATALTLHEKYVQLTRQKELRMRENAALRRTNNQHLSFQKKLGAATAVEKRERMHDVGRERMCMKEHEASKMTPMTVDMCYDVIRPACVEVRDFLSSRSLNSCNAVLGWTHRYRLDGKRLQYSISKYFPARTAQEISDRGWSVMTTESSYKALHSRGLTSNLHSIQKVNEDNHVFCRELQRPGQRVMMKTLLLASRFQVDDGLMTIYRALDHDKLGFTSAPNAQSKDNDPSPFDTNCRVVWLDMFAWTSFEDRSDGGVDFHFGGEMKHFSADNAHFWMMEVLLMALRWESRTVGPLITLEPTLQQI